MELINRPKDTDFHELLLIIAPELEARVGSIYIQDISYHTQDISQLQGTSKKSLFKQIQYIWQEQIKEVMAKAKSQNISEEDRCQII